MYLVYGCYKTYIKFHISLLGHFTTKQVDKIPDYNSEIPMSAVDEMEEGDSLINNAYQRYPAPNHSSSQEKQMHLFHTNSPIPLMVPEEIGGTKKS